MGFMDQWKGQVQERLGAWGRTFEAGTAQFIYGSVAGMTLWPVVKAAQAGQNPFEIGGALATVAGAVGGNLIANLLQTWRDSALTEARFVEDVGHRIEDEAFREAVDKVVQQLDVLTAAQAEMSQDLSRQFQQTLRAELGRLGNLARFEAVLGDGAAMAYGKGSKAVGNGVLIEGDVKGPVLVHGSTYIENQNVTQGTGREGDSKAAQAETDQRRAYLRHLYEDAEHISLRTFAKEEADKAQSLVKLGAIYTALGTKEIEAEERSGRPTPEEAMRPKDQRRLSAVEVANRQSRLVLLGDPGSGKSTFIHHLVLCMTGELLGNKEIGLKDLVRPLAQGDESDKVGPVRWDWDACLPIVIQLRDFGVKSRGAKGEKGCARHLWDYIRGCLDQWGLASYLDSLRREVLAEDTPTLLLLDGLDEVPDPDRQRRQIKEAIEDLAKCACCRIIVTSRTYAYQKQDWALDGFHPVELAPFNEAQIRFFIDHWYAYQATTRQRDKEDAQGRAKLLADAIFHKNRNLQGLAERPLLLTLMAVLHSWHGRDLPEKRVDLYEQTLELLIHRWDSTKDTLDKTGRERFQDKNLSEWLHTGREGLRQVLEKLAFEAHGRQDPRAETADVPKKDLIYELAQIAKDVPPCRLEEHLKERMGILIEHGHDVFTFPHRTFQEYLAACYLTREGFPKQIAELTRKDPQRWREVAQLVGLKVNTFYAVWGLVQQLQGEGSCEADAWGTLISGEFVVESDWKVPTAGRDVETQTLCSRLSKVLERSVLPAQERALAGRLLAQLGDGRPGVMTVEAMEFLLVHAGPFWMGEGREAVQVDLGQEFYMARFPVSNAQFRRFMKADGYGHDAYWKQAVVDKRWRKGELKAWVWQPGQSGPQDRWVDSPEAFGMPFGLDNHPVVGISWYEAMAFCVWATEHLKAAQGTASWIRSLLDKGWVVGLPSEQQWEKAARGAVDRRTYPWDGEADPDKANYADTKIGSTSALGCFPEGHSLFGCEDMAGNVWEWCRTRQGGTRVVRGGSFVVASDVRCSCRRRYEPNNRYHNVGFRVSVCPHFSEI